jgi:hypothetical protein
MSVKPNPSTSFHAEGSNSSETMCPSLAGAARRPRPFNRPADSNVFEGFI